ncbi:MAG: hypothetical protein BMS9Abin34_208 [Patescibacteria group bacterium]|nr:MAG: hypothetical protein BMS9Abin34_208 [Patescibacteria group bacterium]
MQLFLILAAVVIFIKLAVNLLYIFMERRFASTFGFPPPDGKDKYAIRALQPKVDQHLRKLAANDEQNKAARQELVDKRAEFPLFSFTPFGKFTVQGKQLRELSDEYNYLATFDSALGLAGFFNFQISEKMKDYL